LPDSAVKVLRMCTGYLLSDGKVDYIHCGCFDFNSASRKLLEKAGFTQSSTHRTENATVIDMILKRQAPVLSGIPFQTQGGANEQSS